MSAGKTEGQKAKCEKYEQAQETEKRRNIFTISKNKGRASPLCSNSEQNIRTGCVHDLEADSVYIDQEVVMPAISGAKLWQYND
eukprot:7043715-Ditylum_brightwellii.AAC.1